MIVTWLGQAGLLFETENNFKIMVDPNLSDSVAGINPKNTRRIPVKAEIFQVRPNVVICTHNHLDHFDMETLACFLDTEDTIQILSPQSVWQDIRKYGKNHNYILFNRHTEWTHENVRFTAVKAEHSDPHPIGVIIDDGSKKFYITGDTLYNTEIFDDIPEDIDVLFLPVNGVGNNMNMIDAARFAEKIKAKKVVPLHWGLFDSINPKDLCCKESVIPKIYEVIEL